MENADPVYWTIAEAAARISDRTISAVEYTQELLSRCRRHEALNSFTSLDPDAVLDRARRADRALRAHGDQASTPGPLHGIPLVVKDNIDVAGQATTGGTPALRDHTVKRDAEVWTRLQTAGALLLGKANMHELAFGVTSNNQAYGPVLNPWDPGRTAGGSSGGTAAAVAGRLAPAGLGTDTGGSVRIPAAHCAAVGLRPSRGRYGRHGVLLVSRTRDTVGPIARSVGDVALLDSVIAPPAARGRTGEGRDGGPAGVRLGVPRAPFWQDLDASTAAVTERRLEDLRRAGAVLVEADLPPQTVEQASKAGMAMALYEAHWELPYYLAQTPPAPTFDELVQQIAGADVRALLDDVVRTPASAYQEACRSVVPAFEAVVAGYVRDHDLAALVYPTCPLPAQPVGHDDTVRLNGRQVPLFATCIRNTDLASIIGWPALALPAGLSDDGLPIGLELCAPPGCDPRLLDLGRSCEGLWEWPSAPDPPPQRSDDR
ncbi:amidase family protein [Spirillospora sp. NPDC048911]|uniref:amidase family protein n=1 Tax=Spirillospora sp. NPDC048911 TaxID=3364527 RepID=UPI003716F6EB